MRHETNLIIFLAPVINTRNNRQTVQYQISISHECGTLNNSLRRRVLQLPENKIVHKSHYLGGRYENIYVSHDVLPEMRTILEVAVIEASRILALQKKELRIGWWLNVMRPGDVTYAHSHDNDEELLSGVYYIDVPFNSGRLVLAEGASREQIEPSAGMFVFFAPDLLHEVTHNRSYRPRISVGFNLGRLKTP